MANNRCDAEPSVLADYVIALLKHDKEDKELMDLCASQLQDFLREDTAAFLEDLFKFLNVKSNTDPMDYNEPNTDSNSYNDRFRDRKRNGRDQRPYKRGVCRDYAGNL
jgi:RNA-binding protein 26